MGFLTNAKNILNEAWQAYVIGKNYDYLSHIASNLQGRALSESWGAPAHSFVQALYGELITSHFLALSNLNHSSMSAPSISPAHLFL